MNLRQQTPVVWGWSLGKNVICVVLRKCTKGQNRISYTNLLTIE